MDRPQVPPVSTTLQVIINLVCQYFGVYTMLIIAKVLMHTVFYDFKADRRIISSGLNFHSEHVL